MGFRISQKNPATEIRVLPADLVRLKVAFTMFTMFLSPKGNITVSKL